MSAEGATEREAAGPSLRGRWDEQQRWWDQFERENPSAEKLRAHLSFMVPLRIMELRQQGGPTPDDYERVRGYVCPPGFFWGEDPPACVGPPLPEAQSGGKGTDNTLLCRGAEALLFPADFPREVAAEWRRKLVDACALLAFAPGGVRLLGLAFEAQQA